jgi:hypothetical protein
MLHLPDITLLSISGTDDTTMFLEHFRSLCYSKQKIKFGKIKILSPIKPIDFLNDIEYVKINNNEFMLPLFMRTPQGNDYSPSNYIPAVVVCYALPGQGTRIANRIRRSGFDFKQFKLTHVSEIFQIISEQF